MADDEQRITEWVNTNIGGKVVAIRRQPRWRPVFLVDVERGARRWSSWCAATEPPPRRCSRWNTRCASSSCSKRAGSRFPTFTAGCDEPRAFVTDRVPGEDNFDHATDAERESVMNDYMRILARIHALDVEVFARNGITRAATPAQSGQVGMDVYERGYRQTKQRPDPFLEFCLGWLARNPLPESGRESVIVWDSGQFHHQGGKVTAVLDLELGHIGDPMMDLAGFRMRDTVLGFGDMNALYDQYAAHGGQPVDIAAIQHHHFAFTLSNQLAFHAALAAPTPDTDYMTNMQWCSETNLFAIEALAEILGIEELDAVEEPVAGVSPVAVAHEHLVRSLRSFDVADEFDRHQLRIAFRSRATCSASTRSAMRSPRPTSTICERCSARGPRPGKRATPHSRASSCPTGAHTTRIWCSSSTGASCATR